MPQKELLLRKTLFYAFGFCTLLLGVWLPGAAQTPAVNPFDLTPRLGAVQTQVADKVIQGNPFDLSGPTLMPEQRSSVRKQIGKPAKKRFKKIVSNPDRYAGFLISIVTINLLYLTLLFTLQRNVFQKSFRGAINENLLNQVYRERSAGMAAPFIAAYILFFMGAGMLIFFTLHHKHIDLGLGYWLGYLACVLAVAFLYLIKHLILSFIGVVFPVEKEVSLYSFAIMIFSIISGLALVPLNLIIAYAKGYTEFFIYLSFGICIVIYLLQSLRGLFIGNKFLLYHKFHLLLYICSVEVAPVLILIKVLGG